ncbi:uncharacterized protein B0H18DRAFT_1003473 [Fomitopsis serialis]|uniref:uncharacterized protein n=1 Tax=Fomitopsis serialis TaxID=139415 RepID=UPI0020076C3D|nr:uncharacterized protein B0H18DRAFT_1003473 [Neoantrodia serialis]KAH9927216.1 hypothetical protein B0H18DRAFT_1003473 [Neoantrodia serialis]
MALAMHLMHLVQMGLVPEDYGIDSQSVNFEDMINLAADLGATPETIGDVLAEMSTKFNPPTDGTTDEEDSKYVEGNGGLLRLKMSMSPEEQAVAAVEYKAWFEGGGGGPQYIIPKASPRTYLIATQVAARRDQVKQFATQLEKGQSRSIVKVTGFSKHSSKAPWDQLEPILLSDMFLRRPATGRSLRCRIIAPCTSFYAMQTVVEDEEGQTFDFSFYNYPTTFDASPQDIDILFPKGTVLLVREPVIMPSQQSDKPLVRVESPTDIVPLAPYRQMLPGTRFETTTYTSLSLVPCCSGLLSGLKINPGSLVLRLNRAEAYMRLDFFSGALYDARSVLVASELPPALRNKALLRAARAEYGRRNYAIARQLFQQHRGSSTNNAEDASWIRRCEDRLRESSTGKYDWAKLFEESQRNSRLDAADYTGPVEVKDVPGHGRGIVATKDIAAGELLMVSKAISMVAERDLRADMWRSALNCKTSSFMTRSQCANIAKAAQTIYGNPDVYAQVLHLYAGPDYPLPPVTSPPSRLDLRPVEPLEPTINLDVGRLEAICLYNSFDQCSLHLAGYEYAEDGDMWHSPNALHLLPSLLNHSCAGNARVVVFGDILAVRAVAPIRAGEEVTVPYVSPDKGYHERAKALQRYFPAGWECECTLCVLDRADGADALKRREAVVRGLTAGPLFQEPMDRLRGFEAALRATYAEARGTHRPALARVVHSIGEKLRADVATQTEALETTVRALVSQGFVMTDATRRDTTAAALKRRQKDTLPVDVTDLSRCMDVERGVLAMLRIAVWYRAEVKNVVQAKRWLKAAQSVVNVEYGGGRELFLSHGAKVLESFGLTQYAETVL